MRRLVVQLIGGVALVALAVAPARAQLNTQHIKGTVGLKGGSQPPPHVYVIAPLVYLYNGDRVKDAHGGTFLEADLNSAAFGGGVTVVTTKKLLGGFYGYTVLFPVWANNRIQGTEIDANPGVGLTDSVVSPITLGWHLPRADVTTGYTIYVPTGRYEDGANDNTGLGMWGHELTIGGTVYLTGTKQYHASTVASFNFQSKKEDSETKVGNAMNLEGGVGGDFLKGGLTAGVVYYASFKLTPDRIEGLLGNQIPLREKNRVFALGPEVQLALARKGILYGFLKANYQWETYARVAPQGSEFTLMLTLLVRPLKLGGS